MKKYFAATVAAVVMGTAILMATAPANSAQAGTEAWHVSIAVCMLDPQDYGMLPPAGYTGRVDDDVFQDCVDPKKLTVAARENLDKTVQDIIFDSDQGADDSNEGEGCD